MKSSLNTDYLNLNVPALCSDISIQKVLINYFFFAVQITVLQQSYN